MIYFSSRFAEHTPPPGHPERPERADVFAAVARLYREAGGRVEEPLPAVEADLRRVHTAEHCAAMLATAARSTMIDADTFTSPETHEVALLAAGAAVQAARHAWEHRQASMALVRPPGHHAEPGRAMGFCLYNNIAIAAAALRADGVSRVAIVDIDVHHGNGTQAAFYDDPSVLYASTHQYPFYPGTGAADETGTDEGKGFTVNLPLPAGATDEIVLQAYGGRVMEALDTFKPDVLLVSAGFDGHQLDPLGGWRMTTAGYIGVVRLLHDAAARLCAGRLVIVTEGGYHLEALRACLEGTVDVLT